MNEYSNIEESLECYPDANKQTGFSRYGFMVIPVFDVPVEGVLTQKTSWERNGSEVSYNMENSCLYDYKAAPELDITLPFMEFK
jgi:hypothetical protein